MPELADIGQKWLDILEPFSYDYNSNFIASEIEERTGIPKRTVSRYLKKMAKRGLLRVERKGKNNSYYIDLDQNESKILLKIVENYKSLKYRFNKDLWPLIDELLDFGGLVLFGSRVKGYSTETSDVDILFLGEKEESVKKIIENHPLKVDVEYATVEEFKNLLIEGNGLAKEVIKSHVVFDSERFIKLCWGYYKNEL